MPLPTQSSSFIPKSALEPRPTRPEPRPTGLLIIISIMAVLISGIILGGALLYRSLLDNEINAPCDSQNDGIQRCGLKATVERERRNIDQLTIQALQRLDRKLGAVDKLIEEHKDLLRVFRLLEKYTLSTISYTSFSYSPKSVAMNGNASSYEDVAIQTQVWDEAKKRNEIQEFMFSDLDQGERGGVKFKLTLVVNPTLILAQTPLP